jgi:hypothetical protein
MSSSYYNLGYYMNFNDCQDRHDISSIYNQNFDDYWNLKYSLYSNYFDYLDY